MGSPVTEKNTYRGGVRRGGTSPVFVNGVARIRNKPWGWGVKYCRWGFPRCIIVLPLSILAIPTC